jgi:hypothetical protein
LHSPRGAQKFRAVMSRLRLLDLESLEEPKADPERVLDVQLESWLSGGSPLPYLEQLIHLGREDEAAASARLALASDECEDRSSIEALLDHVCRVPRGWSEAVREFAANPSEERWDELMRFAPESVLYQRARTTIRRLMELGVDGNVLFLCATRYGTTPEAIELVERGVVDPKTVINRADRSAPEMRALWLGLAARAAFAKGDRFRCVRLLKDAYACPGPITPDLDAIVIRREADDELRDLLDRARIPRA